MLNNISWTNYLLVVIALLLVYYLVIGFKFYSEEIMGLLSGKPRLPFRSAFPDNSLQDDEVPNHKAQSVQPELFASDLNYTPLFEEADDTVQQVQELTYNLKEAIVKAVENNYIKEEFFLSLQLLLKKYSFLKGSPAPVAINNLIASECEKYGYIQLSAEERVMIWNE